MLIGLEYNFDLKSLVASYYNERGQVAYLAKRIADTEMFTWVKSATPTAFRSYNDGYVTKKYQRDLDRFRIEELYLSYYTTEEREMINEYNLPQKYYLDIEVEVEQDNKFPDPAIAKWPINLLTLALDNNIIVLTTLKDFSESEQAEMKAGFIEHFKDYLSDINLHFYYYKTEKELLTKFFHELLPNIPLMTGWNVIDFDWQTMLKRAIFNSVSVIHKLPSNSLFGRSNIPMHTGMIDYIQAMLKFQPLKMVENLTLDYISEVVLKVKKLNNPYSSFYEFVKKDPFQFTLYNIIDTFLVKLIDDKLDLISNSCMISKISHTELNRIFGPVFMTELFMMRGFFDQGKHLYYKYRGGGQHKKYKGAYVHEPIPGYYEYIVAFDFSSMYPHLQIQFNMSPDSYLGTTKTCNYSQYIPEQIVITKNNTVFDITYDSIAKKILQKFYNNRKDANNIIDKLTLELKQEGVEL